MNLLGACEPSPASRQPTTRRPWLTGLVCLGLVGGWAAGDADGGGVGEYQVKAAFLYNFTQFTDWPASAFSTTNAPMVVGIVGEDPFGGALDEMVRGEMVRGRSLVVKRFGSDDDLRGCHVLFISRSEVDRLPALLGQLEGCPVLTVSDSNDFAERGGMIRLFLAQRSVKMEVNPAACNEAGLQMSAKLLKLARIVKSR